MVDVGVVVGEKEQEHSGIFGTGEGTAQAYALLNIANASGQIIGPLLSGGLAETAGWRVTVTVLRGRSTDGRDGVGAGPRRHLDRLSTVWQAVEIVEKR
ncbi:hypothetical protein M432DRAFT_636709 [Thermoascus aurantiacus ATCC 26904]